MNWEDSFTLRSSYCSPTDPMSSSNTLLPTQTPTFGKASAPATEETTSSPGFPPVVSAKKPVSTARRYSQQMVLSGTMFSDGWRTHKPPRLIRTSPFEPLLHPQQLPQYSDISSHQVQQYYAWKDRVRGEAHCADQSFAQNRTRIFALATSDKNHEDKDDPHVPPISEIRIPKREGGCSPTSTSTAASISSHNQSSSEEHEVDYKNLYLCSHRNTQQLQRRLEYTEEENRQLKRKLIEFQRQLFSLQRNGLSSRGRDTRQSSWTIPPSRPELPRSAKRTRREMEGREHANSLAPSVSTEEPPLHDAGFPTTFSHMR
ncbi:predicted protein [Phaeodactylum tricornutum CCAP 1055/1]|uniref:Uncharacterized protein n=1 Tax=Phaeodactylum tricornutum (strain CCAP 1055/1) TaxID=556484 RepID=B7FRX0_PHATC|nr:predicted protein [Phaeodactylum tricornutum CCAP 1055/1]EEC50385.1 predicted protein [Phaeodactylum tricornutum CCAP 1055/1]|eukprot:XP_002177571.1 predicted protein [Phaeodactylum tricornutum CCAP 1055/1]